MVLQKFFWPQQKEALWWLIKEVRRISFWTMVSSSFPRHLISIWKKFCTNMLRRSVLQDGSQPYRGGDCLLQRRRDSLCDVDGLHQNSEHIQHIFQSTTSRCCMVWPKVGCSVLGQNFTDGGTIRGLCQVHVWRTPRHVSWMWWNKNNNGRAVSVFEQVGVDAHAPYFSLFANFLSLQGCWFHWRDLQNRQHNACSFAVRCCFGIRATVGIEADLQFKTTTWG